MLFAYCQAWRISHWEVGETSLLVSIAEEPEVAEDADDALEEEQEFARQTLALLKSGRPLTEEESLSCVLYLVYKIIFIDIIQ